MIRLSRRMPPMRIGLRPGRRSIISLAAAIGFLVTALCILWPSTARAVDFDLTGDCPGATGDVGVLVATIETANSNGLTDTITLAAACTYTLTTTNNDDAVYGLVGLPVVVEPLTIEGNGSTIRRDPAAPDFRFLLNRADALALQHLTFTGGKVSSNLLLGIGGAVLQGGGKLELVEDTFSGNTARFAGGAVAALGGTALVITATTFTDNAVVGPGPVGPGGGGAVATEATTTIVNSTFSGNHNVSLDGSALYSGFVNQTAVRNSTFTANDSPGPAIKALNAISVTNTLVASQASSTNCAFVNGEQAAAYNLADDDTCGEGFVVAAPSQVRLDDLAYNGGSNLTHALFSGSAAINAGDPNFAPPPEYDQRGSSFPRVLSGRVDIGAIEVPAYSIGGTVNGLDGEGLTLQLNGSFLVTVTESGPFTFTPYLFTGNGYFVSVVNQPTNLVQTCSLTNNAGTVAFTNVTTITVTCVSVYVGFEFFVDGNGIGFISCNPVNATGSSPGEALEVRGGDGCEESYPIYTTTLVVATPYNATYFAGWSGDCAGESPQCTLVMSETRTITATFSTNHDYLPFTRKE